MRVLTLHLQATVWCILIMVLSLGLWKADLRIPFYYAPGGDVIFFTGFYKTINDTGWYTHNPALAAPGTMEIYDFPLVEPALFGAIKLLTSLTGNPFVAGNLFYLMSFPLVVWTGLYAFREMGLSRQTAVAASLLFSFSTYHFWRGPHHPQFAAYYAVPLILLTSLRVCAGEPLFWGAKTEGSGSSRWLGRKVAIEAIIASLLISVSGVYFAYFGMAVLVAAGLIAAVHGWQRRSLLDVAVLLAIIAASLLIHMSPFLIHIWRYGYNLELTDRDMQDYYAFAFSLNNMLVPSAWHRLSLLGRWSIAYPEKLRGIIAFSQQNESIGSSPLGLVGSTGLIVLIALGVSSPVWLHRRFPGLLNIARLTLAILVFALMGAVSEMVALHVTQMFRAYNRISIFVLFLGLLAVGLLVQSVLKSQRGFRGQLLLVGLTTLALFDQVPAASSPQYANDRSAFEADHAFVQQMESYVAPGSPIFQFPVVWYPAFGDLYQMEDHNHLRGYLHGQKLRWSYGAVPGRPTYRWQKEVAALAVPEMVSRLSDAGFSGIYINTLGYKDRGRKLLEQLRDYLGTEPLVGGAKGELRFFRLPPANAEKTPRGRAS
ncbi:MAG: hypothetical protein ACLP7Q_24940 [Isosphaeraceae bacterium]